MKIKAKGLPNQVVELLEGDSWQLGRTEETDIAIPERSVSRHHLTIHRLNTRFCFQDQGSRFGTNLNESRTEVAMLADQDELGLGRAEVVFEDLLDDPTRGLHPADAVELVGVLRRLAGRGGTVWLATHDPVLLAEGVSVDLG